MPILLVLGVHNIRSWALKLHNILRLADNILFQIRDVRMKEAEEKCLPQVYSKADKFGRINPQPAKSNPQWSNFESVDQPFFC